MPIIAMSVWCSLPNEVRARIRAVFNIPRSSSTHVDDGRLMSDGTTYEDFKSLTVGKMQEFLNEETDDFYKLFDMVVARINDELIQKHPTVTNANTDDAITVVVEPKAEPKKRGRPAKNETQK